MLFSSIETHKTTLPKPNINKYRFLSCGRKRSPEAHMCFWSTPMPCAKHYTCSVFSLVLLRIIVNQMVSAFATPRHHFCTTMHNAISSTKQPWKVSKPKRAATHDISHISFIYLSYLFHIYIYIYISHISVIYLSYLSHISPRLPTTDAQLHK